MPAVLDAESVDEEVQQRGETSCGHTANSFFDSARSQMCIDPGVIRIPGSVRSGIWRKGLSLRENCTRL